MMTPTLPRAAQLFDRGQYRQALSLYQSLLTTLKESQRPPRSLLAFCETRVQECRSEVAQARANQDLTGVSPYDVIFENPSLSERFPQISIVIPHYNSAGLIYQALDSIAAQTFRDIETLVVDDCSEEAPLAPEQLSRYPGWMRLRVIEMRRNSGPANCRNLGVELAQGRAVCFLDADDYLDGGTLESRWKIINGDATIAAAFSTMTYINVNRQPLGSIILGNSESISYTDFSSNKFPCSALMFRRRNILTDLFDPKLICGEDYECFSRIAQRGGIYKHAPGGTIFYRQHGDSLTHKDALLDLQRRIDVTRAVHRRELEWSAVRYSKNLPEAVIVKESSLRGFPVACIYAMRHDISNAKEIGLRLDPDSIASQPAKQIADSIRFFLTREEFQPTSEVSGFLEQSDKACLLRFFDSFFRARHRTFVVALLHALLGKLPQGTVESLPQVLGAPLNFLSWSSFLNSPDAEWNGYLVLHRATDRMSADATAALRLLLRQRGDLDGVFLHRTTFRDGQTWVDVDSISPSNPDSGELRHLGSELRPALVIHELAARSLRAWLLRHIDLASNSWVNLSENGIEGRILAGVHSLRLKVVGGQYGCSIQNTSDEETL